MSNAKSEAANWRSIFQRERTAMILILCFGIWLHAASSMLAATTLPSAVREIGGASVIGWAFMLYQIGSIVAAASTEPSVRRLGLRHSLRLAATLYGIGCLVAALAPSMAVLLAGRLLQGAGGGWLLALSFITVNRTFAHAQIPKVMALISTVWSMSAFCGPVVGGTFATFDMWRMAFYAFAIQAVLFILLLTRYFAKHDEQPASATSTVPVVRLMILATAVLSIASASVSLHAIASPMLIGLGIALLLYFVHLDSISTQGRMLPTRAFDTRTPLGTGLLLILTGFLANMSFLVYGPLLLEQLHGVSPLGAGYIVALESVAWGVTALAVSGANATIERWLVRLGPVTLACGVLGVGLVMPIGPWWMVVPCAVLMGAGFGMMHTFVMRRIVNAARPEERDLASTAVPTTQQIGMAVGAASAGIVGNLAGLDEGVSQTAAQTTAQWVFLVFLPLTVCCWFFALRLVQFDVTR